MVFQHIKYYLKDNDAELFSYHRIYLFREGQENNSAFKIEELN